jgi:hypothetical protein
VSVVTFLLISVRPVLVHWLSVWLMTSGLIVVVGSRSTLLTGTYRLLGRPAPTAGGSNASSACAVAESKTLVPALSACTETQLTPSEPISPMRVAPSSSQTMCAFLR